LKRHPLKLLAVSTLLSLLVAAALTETVLYSRNRLVVHPEWILGKRLLAAPIMGSRRAFTTRNLLHRNRLNLHEWFGFNELLLNRIVYLGSLRLKFRVSDGGYLIILFNRDADTFSGVRFSRSPRFPSIFFHATAAGMFLEKHRLSDLHLSGGWHDVELGFDSNALRVVLDDELVGQLPETSHKNQIIGFRAGHRAAIVDDVEARTANGQLLIREDFRNHRGCWKLLIGSFAVVFGLTAGTYFLRRRQGSEERQVVLSIIMAQLVSVVILVMLLSFDHHFWSQQYNYKETPEWTAAPDELLAVEKIRQFLFSEFPFVESERATLTSLEPQRLIDFLKASPRTEHRKIDLKVITGAAERQQIDLLDDSWESIEAYLGQKPLDSSIRVLLLGTSQMWGTGASSKFDRIAVQLHRILSAHFGGEIAFSIVNASKRGSRSSELSDRYRDHLQLFRPDLVVVSLSNNDPPVGFDERLASILELDRALGAQSLFVLEANSTEVGELLEKRHALMIGVAEQHGIPWLDLHGYLADADVYDTGILWWDRIHLTSYGQSLAAAFIAEGMLDGFEFSEGSPRVRVEGVAGEAEMPVSRALPPIPVAP